MVEFEHTIFIILLLTGVLNAKPPRQNWAIMLILIGILLVFIPPAIEINVPWEVVLGLVIPLLLWQNIRRIIIADWRGWKSVSLWVISVWLFSFALWLGGALNLPGALLFGVIGASMVWRAGELEGSTSYMSQVGPLALIFLLTEVEIAIQSPNQYIGGIFSAAFFGAVIAILGLYFLRKLPLKYHSWIGIGQVYLAYWLSLSFGVSAVAGALVSIMTFVWLNQYYQLGFHETAPLAPLNTWPGFAIILALFLLLGWQAHQPISALSLIEVAAGVMISLCITWIGRHYKIPAFQNKEAFWMAGLRAGLLLFPALLIWPRDIFQQPLQLAVALGSAALVIGMSYMALLFYFPRKNMQ